MIKVLCSSGVLSYRTRLRTRDINCSYMGRRDNARLKVSKYQRFGLIFQNAQKLVGEELEW